MEKVSVNKEDLDRELEQNIFIKKDETDEKNTSKKKGFFNWSFVLSGVISLILGTSLGFFTGGNVVNKAKVTSELSTLIENDADLRAIKFYYNNKTSEKRGVVSLITGSSSNYIDSSTPLSTVLEHIRTSYYLESKSTNEPENTAKLEFIRKLELVIKEYGESNPFDKLNSTQKDLFENVRVKLGNDYQVISSDINKLSDELYNKNMLVNEYLSDSNTSLTVSIISAFMAVLLAGFQMYQGRTSKLAKDISKAIDIEKRSQRREIHSNHSVDENGYRVKRTVFSDGTIKERRLGKDGTVSERVTHPNPKMNQHADMAI